MEIVVKPFLKVRIELEIFFQASTQTNVPVIILSLTLSITTVHVRATGHPVVTPVVPGIVAIAELLIQIPVEVKQELIGHISHMDSVHLE